MLLIRHADASEGDKHEDRGRHLTAIGRMQAQALARRVGRWQVDASICTDMIRARETAQAIRVHHPDVPFIVDPTFRDISTGTLEQAGASGNGELDERLEEAWRKVTTLPYGVVLVITHNGMIKYLIGRAIKYHRKLKPRFHSAYAGITALGVRREGRALLQFFSDTSHITPDIVSGGGKMPWTECPRTGRWYFDLSDASGRMHKEAGREV